MRSTEIFSSLRGGGREGPGNTDTARIAQRLGTSDSEEGTACVWEEKADFGWGNWLLNHPQRFLLSSAHSCTAASAGQGQP